LWPKGNDVTLTFPYLAGLARRNAPQLRRDLSSLSKIAIKERYVMAHCHENRLNSICEATGILFACLITVGRE